MTTTRLVLALWLACSVPVPAMRAAAQAVCGNNALEGDEQCDDGNTANGDGCNESCQVRLCLEPPPTDCIQAFDGTLSILERGKEDKRTVKLRLELGNFSEDVALLDLGDPVFGLTRYDLCIYGELDYTYGQVIVARGFDTCGENGKSCWRKKGENAYAYSDPESRSGGVRKVLLQAAPRGGGRVSYTAARTKKAPYLPFMNGPLAGDAYSEVRLMTSDGRCIAASFTDVLVNNETRFKARIE